MKRIIGTLVLLVSITILPMSAQDVNGNLEGWIMDSEGISVDGVTISVSGLSLQGHRGTSTNNDGFFRLLALPSGKYTVKLSHVAYQPSTLDNVQIRLGKTTTIGEVVMRQDTLQMAEVVVSGRRPLLDPVSTTSGANLEREDFEVLPMERNYRSIASILPHANQSYYGDEVNIAGSSGLENRYFVNGNEVTNAVTGVGGINLPYNFIREVEVKTGGYEPEYKSSLGGIVNVVTYSGGNDFSGQVFGFYTNNNFGGEQQLATTEPPKGAFAQYDVGFTLGGPILKDELWVFGAYSPFFRDEDIKLPGLGYYPDEQRTHSFAGKLTWKASDVLDVSATILGDPTKRKAVGISPAALPTILNMKNPDPLLSDITSGSYGFLLDARHVASDNLILQGSLSITERTEKYEPGTEAGRSQIPYLDFTTSTLSGGYPAITEATNTITDGKFSATEIVDRHMIKMGVEYKEIVLNSLGEPGSFLMSFSDTNYVLHKGYGGGKIKYRVPSVYVQDSWSVSKALRITGGIRWDGLFIIATNGQLASRVLRQYQPRLGVVFIPGGDESRKIFASIGRYAEDLLMNGSSLYHNDASYQTGLHYNHDPRVDPSGYDTLYSIKGSIPPGVQDLYGQYYDELALGYEQLLAEDFKITARGTYRRLREIIEDAENPPGSGKIYFGNPGEEPLTSYPFPRRDYLSLELTLEKSWGSKVNFLASYVLSRNVAREKRTCERTNLLLLEICLSEHGVFPDDGRRSRSERLFAHRGLARATMRNAYERSTKCGANVAHLW